MAAIAKPTGFRGGGNLRKSGRHTLRAVPQGQFPHARGVHQHRAPGQSHCLPMHGGMPPVGVLYPNFASFHHCVLCQRVDQAGFSHPGRPQQHRPLSRLKQRFQCLQPRGRAGAEHQNRRVPRHGLHPRPLPGDFLRRGQVRFGQKKCRLAAAFLRLGQIPLQPVQIQLLVQGSRNQHPIEIGRHRLPGPVPGIQPGEKAAAGRDLLNHPVAPGTAAEKHHISYGGHVLPAEPQTPLHPGIYAPGLRPQFKPFPMHRGDASPFPIASRGGLPVLFRIVSHENSPFLVLFANTEAVISLFFMQNSSLRRRSVVVFPIYQNSRAKAIPLSV